MRVIAEKAQVLITVKTSPQPSTKYKDTVCTAGVRLDDDSPRWICLYPIPFRHLETDLQFKKYDLIELEIRRRHEDSRKESYSPDWSSVRRVDHFDPWERRVDALRNLPLTNTCELSAAARADHAAPSLGLGGVADLTGLTFERHPGWNEKQRAILSRALEEVDLFGSGLTPRKLEPPRLVVTYRYRCTGPTCSGHRGQILDWELTALQQRLRSVTDSELKRVIETKFVDEMFASGRDSHFLMGNFENPVKRDKFSVLGVWYPRQSDVEALPLF
ncbi:hypothetical protein [Microcella sp.]|uniref:hypothetical protein n=1 Tax=Microcella sp. TaxID=1913979 RepID=UPI0025606128|nr:hypothetical protein [Microcella sp.]MBX9471411.1 hypothetical protein [Microcella sp.]MBX9473101.1 hypothetical protein [Microcella sp.]